MPLILKSFLKKPTFNDIDMNCIKCVEKLGDFDSCYFASYALPYDMKEDRSS